MDYFNYQQDQLYAEQVSLSAIAAQFGTPCYVYSQATIERHWQAFATALAGQKHLVCYAVKANSNLAILKLLADLGAGFDIVSGGELQRVLKIAANSNKIVFSGVGKSSAEIKLALGVGIKCFNVESSAELWRLADLAAEMQLIAPISLRVNPDVDANTHPYISTGLRENKFGIDVTTALELYQQAATMPQLKIVGIDCHIGSQLTDTKPFIAALERIMALVRELSALGIKLQHIDLGGGLGVRYANENPPSPQDYIQALQLEKYIQDQEFLIEPGRAIIANAGILLSKVEYIKSTADKNFAIVDAAMNDLLRPALYSAWHDIVPVIKKSQTTKLYDVVGPVCETGDFLGKQRELAIQTGDLLAIRSAGAYGFSMSSNYNSRPRAAEVLVNGDQVRLIRRRETMDDLFALELE